MNIHGHFSNITPSSSSLTSTITVTAKQNLLIHHPDLLITATALSNAPQCRRRPLIQGLVRSPYDSTPALVWGNMLHEVMQACLLARRWEEHWITDKIKEVVMKSLLELVKIGATVDQAVIEVKARAKGLYSFAEKYVADVPKVRSPSLYSCNY